MAIDLMVSEQIPTPDAIVLVLKEAGIDLVFGISGGHTGTVFGALSRQQNAIRTVLVREESLAGVMAEVYGRLTRRPGVVLGQGPWVLGNGLIGTIEAYFSSSPMLLLTDFSDTPAYSLHGPYQSGTGDYGSWDARRSFGGVTKQVFSALDAGMAVQATQLAIKHAMAGQPGPVAVLLSIAALSGQVGPETRPRLYPTAHYLPPAPAGAEPARVAEAAEAIRAAKCPVIVAGNGVRIAQAYDALRRLAERLGAPVVTTPSGKGVLEEVHPLALGVFGTFGTAAANAAVAEADLVIVAGSKLTASDTARENTALLDPTRQVFVQIDVEPKNAAWTYPAEHQLLGDAGAVMAQLLEHLPADRRVTGEARVAAHRRRHGYFDFPEYDAPDSPVLPQRIVGDLHRHLPEDVMICCDAGENRIFMMHLYQTRRPGHFVMAAGAGPMGFAIPAAMAVKLIHPDRPVVAVCGDGGFSMTMNGLLTALENDIPITVIVFNNSALGWSLHSRGPFAAEFQDFDYAAIASAMGCEGHRVNTPEELAPAIRAALASRLPAVIDVRTSLASSYIDMTSPLAKG